MSKEEDSPTVAFDDSDEEDSQGFADNVAMDPGTLPLFHVKVTEALKDGVNLQFTIMSSRQNKEEGSVVTRQFEDIEWLHHQLVVGNETRGIIVPPLPTRPEFDPKSVESRTKKQLGSDCHVLRPDDFDMECKAVEKYLSMMLSHPTFGRDKTLEVFLCEKEAAVRTKLSKGIMGWLSTTIDSARKGQHKDIDEFFGQQREWVTEYSKTAKEASLAYDRVIQSQWRLTSVLQHFASSLTGVLPHKDESTKSINKLMLRLSESVEDSRKAEEKVTKTDEKSLGFELELLSRSLESVKEMLFQRTCLMIAYEDATRAVEKAKPQKKQAAEETKKEAEAAYKNCCENAKKELKAFMLQRVLALQECLVLFTEAQIKGARDTYTQIVATLKDVQTEM